MTDIPRGPDTSTPRSAWAIFMLGGFEALTTALRRGQAIRDVDDLTMLRSRYGAFCAALDARLEAHGMSDLIEDDEQ